MINTGYLFSKDNSRVFINTSLGCTGKCQYCYLGKIGYSNLKIVSKIKKAQELIEELNNSIQIDEDTLITLGCFSECLDENNKGETLNILKYFLKKGNQIQLSTKKYVDIKYFKEIKNLISYKGQLVIFVSSATISKAKYYENGTDMPKDRFKNFNIIKELDIPTVLYLKPILKDITIKDIELYKKLIIEKEIKDIVVGSIFSEKENLESVHFLDNKTLFYNPISDEEKIKNELSMLDNVRIFSRSSEVMKFYRKFYK